ncbi:uncharacterized protein LOC144090484 isoform X3 [Stigmatopora argus]
MSHMQRNAEKRGTNQLNKSDPGGATRYDASKMTKFTHAVSSSRCRTPDQWGPLGSGVGHTHAFAVGAFDWTSLTATETFMQIDEGPIWSLPPNGGVSKNAAPAGHVPHGCIQKSCGVSRKDELGNDGGKDRLPAEPEKSKRSKRLCLKKTDHESAASSC